MCLYPRLMKNKRFLGDKEALCKDIRQLYVPIGCGECFECRKQKAQQWRVRMLNEIKNKPYKYFITLTFSNKSLDEITKAAKQDGIENITINNINALAQIAIRRFLERWRKKYKKSLRHWIITELGHTGTERLHLHGIIIPENPITNEELQNIWKYGITDTGQYVNERTINYIVKYVTKIDSDHKTYKPKIFCSAGIGKNYVETWEAKHKYKYIKDKSAEDYTLNNGNKIALPIYYRNKLYTEEERVKIWSDRLDKHIIYCAGQKINISTKQGRETYLKVLKTQQTWNEQIGYGKPEYKWEKDKYNKTLNDLNKETIPPSQLNDEIKNI